MSEFEEKQIAALMNKISELYKIIDELKEENNRLKGDKLCIQAYHQL